MMQTRTPSDGAQSVPSSVAENDWSEQPTHKLHSVEADALPDLSTDMSGLDVYMARLRNFPPLSKEKQTELARRYCEEGDAEAGRMLVSTNLRLVITLAMDYSRDRNELLELIQEGNVGISKALERFDPSKNVRFTSYAQYWIRAKILDYLINRGRPIRLGSSRAGRKIFYNLHKARKALRKQGHEPTPERLAEYLDVDERDVVQVGKQMESPPASLDRELTEEGGRTLADVMESDVENPEDATGRTEIMEKFREELRRFGEQLTDDRRRAIWYQRTVATEPKLLRVLGDEWDVSKERIRQIESELCDEFRRKFSRQMGGREEIRRALRAC